MLVFERQALSEDMQKHGECIAEKENRIERGVNQNITTEAHWKPAQNKEDK